MKIAKTYIKICREKEFTYNKIQIKNVIDIVKLVNKIEDIQNLDTENAFIICLNNKNEPVNYSLISKGTINASLIDIKSIFKNVFLSNASSFVFVHNHPSGDSTPSKQDLDITKKLKDASDLLDIKFLDHVIIGEDCYTSLFEEMS